jgi:hypothetical protein
MPAAVAAVSCRSRSTRSAGAAVSRDGMRVKVSQGISHSASAAALP